MDGKWRKRRRRLYEIIDVGYDMDGISRVYDIVNVISIVANLTVSILSTFSSIKDKYGTWLVGIEVFTVAFFALDYLLRLLTARVMYQDDKSLTEGRAICKYVFSFMGIVDLFSFLPYFLPFFFPTGTVAFRMIRIMRIFRLFRINAYYDSFSVITEVLYGKRQQLISSVMIILILMVASSLCMYSLENGAQPDVFTNAFSGIWWAASTLLTVGYGDIYPITFLGKIFGIIITFLGVGMVAIPTGIISAGFVDQYSTIKKRHDFGYEADMNFIKVSIREAGDWCNRRIADLDLPDGLLVAIVKRGDEVLIPRGDVVLKSEDVVVIGAEPYEDHDSIALKEVVLKEKNPWVGRRIKELDISRHSIIVLVKRKNKALIPNGTMILQAGDRVFMYTNLYLHGASSIEI